MRQVHLSELELFGLESPRLGGSLVLPNDDLLLFFEFVNELGEIFLEP